MKFKLLVLVMIGIMFVGGAFSAEAAGTIKLNAGYYKSDVKELAEYFDQLRYSVPENHIYVEVPALFNLGKSTTFSIGLKPALAYGKNSEDNSFKLFFSLSGAVEYNYSITNALSIGVGANIGPSVIYFDAGSLNTKALRPYITVGPYLNVSYNVFSAIYANLTCGYNYNVALSDWYLSSESSYIETNNETLTKYKTYSSFYIAAGVGIRF